QGKQGGVVIVGDVAADDGRVLIVGIDEVDRLVAGGAERCRLVVGVGHERDAVRRVEGYGERREVHAGVAVLVRQPDIRRAPGEDAGAAAPLRALCAAGGQVPG